MAITLDIDVDGVIELVTGAANEAYVNFVQELTTAIVEATPVDTGLLLSNWRLHSTSANILPRIPNNEVSPYGGRTNTPNAEQSPEERRGIAITDSHRTIQDGADVLFAQMQLESVAFDNETPYAIIREGHPSGAYFMPIVDAFRN